MDAENAVATGAMVTLASTIGFSAAPQKYGGKGEFPSPRLLIGGALTFWGLAILATFAPGLAGPLAVTIAVTAFLSYGAPVLENVFAKEK